MVCSNKEFSANKIGIKMPEGEGKRSALTEPWSLLCFFFTEKLACVGTRTFDVIFSFLARDRRRSV